MPRICCALLSRALKPSDAAHCFVPPLVRVRFHSYAPYLPLWSRHGAGAHPKFALLQRALPLCFARHAAARRKVAALSVSLSLPAPFPYLRGFGATVLRPSRRAPQLHAGQQELPQPRPPAHQFAGAALAATRMPLQAAPRPIQIPRTAPATCHSLN